MSYLVLLKAINDLAMLTSVFGFIAAIRGARQFLLIGMIFVFGLSVMLSYITYSHFTKHAFVRYIFPVSTLLSLLIIPDIRTSELIILGICIFYCVFIAHKMQFLPERYQTVSIIEGYGIAFFIVTVLCLTFEHQDILQTFEMPLFVLSMFGNFILLRSLRHDPKIQREKSFQIFNLISMVLLIALVLIISSPVALSILASVGKLIGQYIIIPIMELLLIITFTVVWCIGYVLALFPWNADDSQLNMEGAGSSSLGDYLIDKREYVAEYNPILGIILRIVAIIILILIVSFILRQIIGQLRNNKIINAPEITERRISNNPAPARLSPRRHKSSGPAGEIRDLYRKYLRTLVSAGIPLKKDDTSEDIQHKSSHIDDPALADQLRHIYLQARYNQTATKDDVAKFKSLLHPLLKGRS